MPAQSPSHVWLFATASCLTLCNRLDCSLPGSSVYGIFQARTLERIAISYSRGSSWPRDWTHVSCIAGVFFTVWATSETREEMNSLKNSEMKKTSRCMDLCVPGWAASLSHAWKHHWNLGPCLQGSQTRGVRDKPFRGRWCPPRAGLRSSPLCFAISYSVANLTFQPLILSFRLMLLNEGPCLGRTVSHLKQRFCVS